MNKTFIFPLILLFSHFSLAQINHDSLLSVWNDETIADTNRLHAIDQIGLDFMESKPDSAIYYAILQSEYAEQKGLKEYIAKSFYILGKAHESKGELRESIYYFQIAFDLNTEIGNKKYCALNLFAIGKVKWTEGNYATAINYYRKSLAISNEIGDKHNSYKSLNGIAYCFFQQGQYIAAAKHVRQSLKICEEIKDDYGIAWCTNAIGVFYGKHGDHQNALLYFLKGLEINRRIRDNISTAISLNNIGETYFLLGDRDKALAHLEESLAISDSINAKRNKAFSLEILGKLYEADGKTNKALGYYKQTLQLSKEIGNRDMESEALRNIGLLHLKQKNYFSGIEECQKSYNVALAINSVEDQMKACECLYKANKAIKNNGRALAFHEKMMALGDSINVEDIAKNLQQMEFQKKMHADSIVQAEEQRLIRLAHEEEVEKKNKTRNAAIISGLFILLFAGGLWSRLRLTRKAKAAVEKEKDRSDHLLLNILPAEIAEELKEKGEASARDFDMASILFTDFKGFTQVSEKLSASELVDEINACFRAFDKIVEKHKIEKIKTIGDAYMAAGGLPVPTDDSVKNTVLAALEMSKFISKRKKEKDANGEPAFEMRAGIHTGPIVAGIVGVKKFQYDIWGDTVNTASRMESHGEVGKVNISQATYKLLKSDSQFAFESRGKINAKGKGEIAMYFVAKA